MSLVGTRPPTVDEWDKYELHHRARLATKPGLTGMWQVSGRSNITDFQILVVFPNTYSAKYDSLSEAGQMVPWTEPVHPSHTENGGWQSCGLYCVWASIESGRPRYFLQHSRIISYRWLMRDSLHHS